MRLATVIPAYNPDPGYLSEVFQCLDEQTVQPDEVLVVDDGSADPVRAPFPVLRQANGGIPAARNAGVAATTAPLVHILDSDELLDPTFYERLIPLPGDVRFARMHIGRPDGQPIGFTFPGAEWTEPADWAAELLRHDVIGSSAAIFTRDIYQRVGGFRQYRLVQDWRFWIDAALGGATFSYCPDLLATHRRHDAQGTASDVAMFTDAVTMLSDLRVPLRYRAARARGLAVVRLELAARLPDARDRRPLAYRSLLASPRTALGVLRG